MSEWYRRDHFLPSLAAIAEKPTWQLQRAECFKRILDETHWRNWHYCLREAKTGLGKAMILSKLKTLWPNASDQELEHYVLQFYLVTLTSSAALSAMAANFYKLDKMKQLEFDLYLQYQRDIMLLDVQIMGVARAHGRFGRCLQHR